MLATEGNSFLGRRGSAQSGNCVVEVSSREARQDSLGECARHSFGSDEACRAALPEISGIPPGTLVATIGMPGTAPASRHDIGRDSACERITMIRARAEHVADRLGILEKVTFLDQGRIRLRPLQSARPRSGPDPRRGGARALPRFCRISRIALQQCSIHHPLA